MSVVKPSGGWQAVKEVAADAIAPVKELFSKAAAPVKAYLEPIFDAAEVVSNSDLSVHENEVSTAWQLKSLAEENLKALDQEVLNIDSVPEERREAKINELHGKHSLYKQTIALADLKLKKKTYTEEVFNHLQLAIDYHSGKMVGKEDQLPKSITNKRYSESTISGMRDILGAIADYQEFTIDDAYIQAMGVGDLDPELLPNPAEMKVGRDIHLLKTVVDNTVYRGLSMAAYAVRGAYNLSKALVSDPESSERQEGITDAMGNAVLLGKMLLPVNLALEENERLTAAGRNIARDTLKQAAYVGQLTNPLFSFDPNIDNRAIATKTLPKEISKDLSKESFDQLFVESKTAYEDLANRLKNTPDAELDKVIGKREVKGTGDRTPAAVLDITLRDQIKEQMSDIETQVQALQYSNFVMGLRLDTQGQFLLEQVGAEAITNVGLKVAGKAAGALINKTGQAVLTAAEKADKVYQGSNAGVNAAKLAGGIMTGTRSALEISAVRSLVNGWNRFKGLDPNIIISENVSDRALKAWDQLQNSERLEVLRVMENIHPQAKHLFTTVEGQAKGVSVATEVTEETEAFIRGYAPIISEYVEQGASKLASSEKTAFIASRMKALTERGAKELSDTKAIIEAEDFVDPSTGQARKWQIIPNQNLRGSTARVDPTKGIIYTEAKFDALPDHIKASKLQHELMHGKQYAAMDDVKSPYHHPGTARKRELSAQLAKDVPMTKELVKRFFPKGRSILDADVKELAKAARNIEDADHIHAVKLLRAVQDDADLLPGIEEHAWGMRRQFFAEEKGIAISDTLPSNIADKERSVHSYYKRQQTVREKEFTGKPRLPKETDEEYILRGFDEDGTLADKKAELLDGVIKQIKSERLTPNELARRLGVTVKQLPDDEFLSKHDYSLGKRLAKDLGEDKSIRQRTYEKHGLTGPEIETLENMRQMLEDTGHELAEKELIKGFQINYTPRRYDKVVNAYIAEVNMPPSAATIGKNRVFPTHSAAMKAMGDDKIILNKRYAEIITDYQIGAKRKVILADLKEDFIRITGKNQEEWTPELQDLYKYLESGGNPHTTKFGKNWQKYVMTPIKVGLLAGHPAKVFRDMVDDGFRSYLKMGGKAMDSKAFAEAAMVYGAPSGQKIKIGGKVFDGDELHETMWRLGVLKLDSVRQEGLHTASVVRLQRKLNAGTAEGMAGAAARMSPWSLESATHANNVFRSNMFIQQSRKYMKLGMSQEKAFWKARMDVGEALVNVHETGAIQAVASHFVPFVNFYSQSFKTYMKVLEENPGRLFRLFHLVTNANDKAISAEERKYLSPYLREQLLVSMGHDEKGNRQYLARLGLSYEAINDFMSSVSDERTFEKLANQVLPFNLINALISERHPFFGVAYKSQLGRRTYEFFDKPFLKEILGGVSKVADGTNKYGEPTYRYEFDNPSRANRILGPALLLSSTAIYPILNKLGGNTLGAIATGMLSSRGVNEWARLNDEDKSKVTRFVNYFTGMKLVSQDVDSAKFAKELQAVQQYSIRASREAEELKKAIDNLGDEKQQHQVDRVLRDRARRYKQEVESVDDEIYNK